MNTEQERRAKERRGGGTSLRVQTPAQAQDPVVAPSNLPTPAQGSGSASDFSAGTPEPRQQQAAPTPHSRTGAERPNLVTAQSIKPVQRMAKAQGRGRRDVLGAQDHNVWQGWWRDRVRENLTDNDGDGRYETPFWWGLGNSMFGGSHSSNGNRAIAERERARNRDAQARALARESGVMDELQLSDDQMYTPEEISRASQQIIRQREQGEGQTGREQELEVIDRGNVPLIEQVRSGERIAEGDRGANIQMNDDNNQTTRDVSANEQLTVRRGQDIDSSLTLAGLESDLDLAELQRAAGQDQIQAQNQLAQMQYQQQLEMWRMDRDDRKSERDEDRRMDSLSALMAGLASLGASFALLPLLL